MALRCYATVDIDRFFMRFSDAWPIDSQNFSKQAADSKFWIRKSASQPAAHRYLNLAGSLAES
jgi:hypothetical protein